MLQMGGRGEAPWLAERRKMSFSYLPYPLRAETRRNEDLLGFVFLRRLLLPVGANNSYSGTK